MTRLGRKHDSQCVPNSPEFFHLAGQAQRYAGIGIERRKGTPNRYVVLLEMIDHTANRTTCPHHDEIGRRWNSCELARSGLAHELVAVGGIALLGLAVGGLVIQREQSATRDQGVQTVFQLMMLQKLNRWF